LGNFARVLHHLDMKDVKKRHLKEHAARKIKEEQDKKEEKVIQEIAKKYKSDWRKELEENFTAVPSGPTNSVSQTFQHVSGQNFSFSGLGGQETHPSTVTVFGDTVPAPNYNQLALAGYVKPLGNVLKRKELEDTNSKLDASQEFAQKVGADVMMNARVDDELDKLKEILDQKTKKLSNIQRRIDELNRLAAQQSKKISKMRDDGLKKINAKYDERQKVRDRMVRKFEASFPSLRYTISGAMQITDKADSDRYYKTQGDFYKKVDATWDAMTKKIDAERKAFLEKMDKLYNSTVGKYNQEEFNLTQYELPTAKAQYDEALKNHSDKLLDKNQLNQEQNMLQGMIDEVTSMFASYFRKQLGGGLPLPVELTLRYAMGNMDPLTNSPGTLYNAITMQSIVNAFNMKSNTVQPHHYHGMDQRIVQAAYNNFSYQITPNGIRVMDTFNFDDPDAGGTTIGAFKVIPGAQWIATQLVKAGDRNARSKGIDPRDDRFGIKVDYTIPKSDMTPEQIKLFYGKSKASTDRTGYGYDTKGKLDSSGYGMDPNRDTETEARPIKTSKTVQKIKSMSKERMARKALSLDQPVVRSSKKSKKKRG